jgi:hypothetical protein
MKAGGDLYNTHVTVGICSMVSSDQMHLNNITFTPSTVTAYAEHLIEEMDDILFRGKDDSDLIALIEMHNITMMSLIRMN